MPIDAVRCRDLIRRHQFCDLFVGELGWDHYAVPIPITVDEVEYKLCGCAHKRGLAVFVCEMGTIPPSALRRRIERQIARQVHEHLIIFTDAGKKSQIWQWTRRERGKPIICREHAVYSTQSGEALIQKLAYLSFSIEEEETTDLVKVAGRVRKALDIERVTKKFYERFRKEHEAFLKLIRGLERSGDREWYASIMLNRLMFIYFIQKRGFIDNNRDYLRARLQQVRATHGKGKFLTFYRYFLRRLMHEGLSLPKKERQPELEKLVGEVPYLNGGIFAEHKLETGNPELDIPDEAFARIFDFFDEYQWNLDERPTRNDREINPDVLGFIFEKYINQKQMGAYYTKEDITEYIAKNTIIPFLLDRARKNCRVAFEPGGALWRQLATDPDRYLYDAVRNSVVGDDGEIVPLPSEAAAGIDDVSKRGNWNQSLPEGFGLPTETWREYVARRLRCLELREIMKRGEIVEINDLITYNLNIRQVVQDAVEDCEGPELLRAFWRGLTEMSVLDPTCGSGAFLFAALNILEPLYSACLDRMESFVAEMETAGTKHRPEKFKDFKEILARAEEHPNRKYFILKTIVLNNLYGVDIMEEAVEICKLRMFLKLVAQIDDREKIEPLPDIDFNVRAGNTLVGFATYAEAEKVIGTDMMAADTMDKIKIAAEDIEQAFDIFRNHQLERAGTVPAKDKKALDDRLIKLADELNSYLAPIYRVKPKDKKGYAKWLESHQPFHWFIEFYGIMKTGGFDVIIGNPPYVELKDVSGYTTIGLTTEDCGDLYPLVMERSLLLSYSGGRFGYIVPLSCFAVAGFRPIQSILFNQTDCIYVSHWSGDAHPAKLFEGVDKRLEIVIGRIGQSENRVFSSKYYKWYSEERPTLFDEKVTYIECDNTNRCNRIAGSIPKIGTAIEKGIIEKLNSCDITAGTRLCKQGTYKIFYTRKVSFFLQFIDFIPVIRDKKGREREPSELNVLPFNSEFERDICLLGFTSNLFYWYNIVNSDCRNLNKREIVTFPIPANTKSLAGNIPHTIIKELMRNYQQHSTLRTVKYANKGLITVQYFNFRPSKPIIDRIDELLAKHYMFTAEELDFIINYDIKYRMGQTDADE